MEIVMDGNGHIMADTHDSPKGVGTQAQMCILTHYLETLSLFLHGIVVTTKSIDFDFLAFHLHSLTRANTFHQFTDNVDARSSGHLLEDILINGGGVNHHLNIINSRTVIQCNKIHRFTTTVSTYPPFDIDSRSESGALEHIDDFCSTHFFHFH